jgi:hypothetical protein
MKNALDHQHVPEFYCPNTVPNPHLEPGIGRA